MPPKGGDEKKADISFVVIAIFITFAEKYDQ
jgi:hypothetical protein